MNHSDGEPAAWVVGICFMGLVFDGYDLVVYGTVLSTLLRDPEWALTPAQAGAIGSYALFGMMVGALAAGAVGDYIGRRRLLLGSIAWFSVGMGLTAMAPDVTLFGAGRFFTGIGIGALVAAAGATVAEFAPPGKRNLYNAIVFAGYPVGGVLASVVALVILEPFGFRTLFWIGALPLVTLLPLAMVKLPESPAWLHSRGRLEEARAVSERTGVPLPDGEIAPVADTNAIPWRTGGTLHRQVRPRHHPDRFHECRWPDAHLRTEHLAARAHGPRRLLGEGVAVVPARAQRRSDLRVAVRLAVRRPLRRRST